jgi:hypothetical protein
MTIRFALLVSLLGSWLCACSPDPSEPEPTFGARPGGDAGATSPAVADAARSFARDASSQPGDAAREPTDAGPRQSARDAASDAQAEHDAAGDAQVVEPGFCPGYSLSSEAASLPRCSDQSVCNQPGHWLGNCVAEEDKPPFGPLACADGLGEIAENAL